MSDEDQRTTGRRAPGRGATFLTVDTARLDAETSPDAPPPRQIDAKSRQIEQHSATLLADSVPGIHVSSELTAALSDNSALAERSLARKGDDADLATSTADLERLMGAYQATIFTEADRRNFEVAKSAIAAYLAVIIIVQHVDERFVEGLATWLGQQSSLAVRLAVQGERPQVGVALPAGAGRHLIMQTDGRLGYVFEPSTHTYRPSVDVFFHSVCERWQGQAVGVLLTGMGADGASGLKALRLKGRHTIAQDRATSAVYGMPKAAAATGAAVDILPLDRIAPRLAKAFPAQTLRVDVVDTGAGVSQDKQDRLFKRFSQVDGSLTRAQGGTGLGLAICKGLVEAMGGEIGLESGAGEGGRFWFEIPAPTASLAKADDALSTKRSLDLVGLRVLVVDDHPANRELARLFLAGVGVEISEAADGEEAVQRAVEWPYELILMDVRMPKLDGPGVLRRIRALDGPNDATPILAFTADADEDTVERLVAMGFQGVVAKPIGPAALINAVARVTALGQDRISALAHAG